MQLGFSVIEMLDEALDLASCSVGIPSTILRKSVDLIKDCIFKARYREEIEEIGNLDEAEIFERLPHYLGLCIAFAGERGDHHVLFLDGHPAVLASAQKLVCRDDVDVVVVATPSATHFELARAALEQGKHVLLEKPATLRVGALPELYRLADEKQVLLQVAFHTAFAEEVHRLLLAG